MKNLFRAQKNGAFTMAATLWGLFGALVSQANPVPDFALVDENTNSARFQQTITPGDYRNQVSLWYFGSAT